MKIGIFDSGLGGLLVTKAIRKELPDHDLFYLGDTLHLPYGQRSQEAVYTLTKNAVDYLFREQNCQIIILACNTASAKALRRLQQTYLIDTYPDRRVLGVIVPTLEHATSLGHTSIGLIGTESTIESGVYSEELEKLNPDIKIHCIPTPLLVPMIENGGEAYIKPMLQDYLIPLLSKNIQSLILGCTHYTAIAKQISDILGPKIPLIAQPNIVPPSLADYLKRHPGHAEKLGRNGTLDFTVTDLTRGYQKTASALFGSRIDIKPITLNTQKDH